MARRAAVVFPDSGCGMQVVIPRANESLDLSGNDVRAGELDDSTADWRPTKLLNKRTSSEFVLAVSTKIESVNTGRLKFQGWMDINYLEESHRRRRDVPVASATNQSRHLSTFPFGTM
jgi:hypothetical protein